MLVRPAQGPKREFTFRTGPPFDSGAPDSALPLSMGPATSVAAAEEADQIVVTEGLPAVSPATAIAATHQPDQVVVVQSGARSDRQLLVGSPGTGADSAGTAGEERIVGVAHQRVPRGNPKEVWHLRQVRPRHQGRCSALIRW